MAKDKWEEGQDEQVEVNQRALIDKVLARYAAEFTVFRELLQNSDDARSQAVEIHFETKTYLENVALVEQASTAEDAEDLHGIAHGVHATAKKLPSLKTTPVHRWTFKNNGIVFREEDWNRLKKIADGNPDEDKIGAFGVGFYSLFSVTEEPRVMSGDKGMRFYFKDGGDQLLVRRRTLDSSETSQWTTFEMPLREPGPIPNPFDFTRFLASSITFMAHLRDVSVWFDDKCLARLTKAPGHPKQLGLVKGLKYVSPQGLMTVRGIQVTPLQIEADVMQWVHTVGSEKPAPVPLPKDLSAQGQPAGGFLSSFWAAIAPTPQRSLAPSPIPRLEELDPLKVVKSGVVLSIYAADVEVKVDRKLSAELMRSTKKNPPSRLKYELIYTGKAEYDASKEDDLKQPSKTGSVFQGLRADLNGTGVARIYIGHATNQTTGLGGHMAARFIPTVERESVDLVDRHVAVWNRELLSVGGILSRSAYETEMATVRALWDGATPATGPGTRIPDAETITWLRKRSLHALQFFTFHSSTPSPLIATEMERAFFACSGSVPFSIISTAGVRSAGLVRLPDSQFCFLKQLPVVPDEFLSGANIMIQALQREGMLRAITYQDILHELRERPLTEEEAIACLRWWVSQSPHRANNPGITQIQTQLLNAAVIGLGSPGGDDERIVPLSTIKTVVNSKRVPGTLIPPEAPLPEHVLPMEIGKHFKAEDLTAAFPWVELSISEWLKHVVNPAVSNLNPDHDVTRSTDWADRVLNILSRAWPNISAQEQADVTGQLKTKTCVPTSFGLKLPDDAYFPNVNLFPDLPIVSMQIKGALSQVLLALGVRKHVELQLVFNRMIKTGDWTISDLTKYLASVQGTLTEDEWQRLRATSAFLKETTVPLPDAPKRPPRYKAGDLYEPIDALRELGLPLIDWGTATKWRGSSEEAKFLYKLGLRRYPPLVDILKLAATANDEVRPKALTYFLDNITTRYSSYDPSDFWEVAFIPANDNGKSRMAAPGEVFVEADWTPLGFVVVDSKIHDDALTKLKIREHPPAHKLVSLLEQTPPRDPLIAARWFEVLAGRISQFTAAELIRLGRTPFIPVKWDKHTITDGTSHRMLAPTQCYFLKDGRAQFHSKLFPSVDFGTRANGFLSACGTKDEPSVEEIALMLLDGPRRFYELADGRNNFLEELKNIAVNSRHLSTVIATRMKRTAILLGSRRVKKEGQPDTDEDNWEFEHDLLRPDQIVIADDTTEYHLFGDTIFACPQEDILEKFYQALGSRKLSTLVKEEYKTAAEIKDSRMASETRALVLERLPLFLHDHSHEGQRLSYDWINQDQHFIVRTFGKLAVAKTLRFNNITASRSMDASAVAKQEGSAYANGAVQLWLAGNTQVDMYEVANSLCRILFTSPKKNDPLLFSAILSTDLHSLRRRGYNVERILKQHRLQREERQAADEAERARINKLVSDPAPVIPGAYEPRPATPVAASVPPPVPTDSKAKPPPAGPSSETLVDPPPPAAADVAEKGRRLRPQASVLNSIQNIKRKFRHDAMPSAGTSAGGGEGLAPLEKMGTTRPSSPYPGVTPVSSIAANIDNAIKGCRPETQDLLQNRKEMKTVKESMNEGYCDVSGQVGELTLVGDMWGIKVYSEQGLPDPGALMGARRNGLERFAKLLLKLGAIYGLPAASLHVFADQAGSLIAFNRNGSLFCNLRYYEAWHDVQVQSGDSADAYISWFFSLAHEIAHNLVQPHNSEHEFYFSAICEAHLVKFTKLLAERSR